jgi:PAS domain S-box-containing protein
MRDDQGTKTPVSSCRALILAPQGRDAAIASAILETAQISSRICADVDDLAAALGDGVSMAVIAEEALKGADLGALSAWIADQEEWSDFPFILLVRGGGPGQNAATARHFDFLGNVSFLERPFHPTTLASLARAAFRARTRQYEARASVKIIRDGESKLRTALRAGNLGAWTLHVASGQLEPSIRCKAHFGRGPEEPFTYEDLQSALHPDDHGPFSIAVQASLKSGDDYDLEYRCVWPDGSLHWVHARGRPEYDSAHTPVLMTGVTQDITTRKQAEDRLRESERQFRTLADAIPTLCWMAGADGGVLWYNERWYRYTGTTFRDMAGWGWQSVHDPAVLPDVILQWTESLKTGREFEMVFPLRGADGSYRPFLTRIMPVRDECGAVIRWFGTNTEISAQKDAEKALRELANTLEQRVSEALAERKILAEIVEATDTFIVVATRDYKLLAVNQASADQFENKFSVRPKPGDNLLDLFKNHPVYQRAIGSVWRRAFDGEEFTEIVQFGDPAEGGHAFEMKFNTLRDSSGVIIGAFQFGYDVTQRLRDQARLRKAEEQLYQTEKINAIGQLTGGIAHDFNNLLTVLSGGLQLLERRADPEDRRRIMDGMRNAADRGATLTKQLLAFSRRQPLKPEVIHLAQKIGAMSNLLDRTLRGDIRVETEFDPDLWRVEADAAELEHAIINLCVNSRDAMPHGGLIRILASNIKKPSPSGHLPADYVRLTIADTGIGIRPEIKTRIFEPFFTTKDIGKGSGLGLAQVYGFVQQSRGSIEIESEPGCGTSVHIFLPRSQKQMASRKALSAGESTPRLHETYAANVLLVEDDTEVAALAGDMLQTAGFEVIHVSSASAALGALANGRTIDVVFSDIMIPGGMSGLDLAREIRRRKPGLPVVLTTGYELSARDAEREGIRTLLKPYRLEDMSALLRSELPARQAGKES